MQIDEMLNLDSSLDIQKSIIVIHIKQLFQIRTVTYLLDPTLTLYFYIDIDVIKVAQLNFLQWS